MVNEIVAHILLMERRIHQKMTIQTSGYTHTYAHAHARYLSHYPNICDHFALQIIFKRPSRPSGWRGAGSAVCRHRALLIHRCGVLLPAQLRRVRGGRGWGGGGGGGGCEDEVEGGGVCSGTGCSGAGCGGW